MAILGRYGLTMARARIILIALFFIAGQRPALACSCARPSKPQLVERASVIFTGTPVRASRAFAFGPMCTTSSADPVTFTFEVQTIYKGDVTRSVDVGTVVSGVSCGYEFQMNKTYTVFATVNDGRLGTGLCTGTTEGAITPSEYGLAEGRPPR